MQWDVDAELLEKQIPKNMIQPLVENALFHGLISEESGELNGILLIRLKMNACGNIVLPGEGQWIWDGCGKAGTGEEGTLSAPRTGAPG